MGLAARAGLVWEVVAECWEDVVVVGYSNLGTGRLWLVLGIVGWWSARVEVVVVMVRSHLGMAPIPCRF